MKEQNKQTTEVKTEKTKERKPSFMHTMKSLKGVIEKTESEKWLNEEDIEQLKGLQKKLMEKYIGLELF